MSTRRVSWIISANTDRWSKNLSGARRSMDRFVRQTERMGRTLTRNVTTPIVAAASASIKMASDFESSMSKIEGLVGLARHEVQGMRADVLGLSGETARAPKELADAMFFITSAGNRGAQAVELLEMSARGAAAGLGETKDIAHLASSAIAAYGSENLSAAQAMDVLVGAVREGKAEASELATSMGQVLPLASELGVTFDQVGAATAAMTRTGTDAATASTQLRQILASLIKPTNQAENAMNKMGTSSAELRRSLREDGLVSVLGFLREQMEDNEQAMAQVFPNIRALSGALDIMGSNADENVEIFRRMTNTTGLLDNAFDAAADTTQFKFQQSFAELKRVAIEFGDTMLPVANKVLESVTNMIRNFTDLEHGARVEIIKIAGLLAAGGPLLLALAKTAKVIAGLATFVFSKFGIIASAFAVGVGAGQWLVDNWQAFGEIIREEINSWADAFSGGFGSLLDKTLSFMARMGSAVMGTTGVLIREQAKFKEGIERSGVEITSFTESLKNGLSVIKDFAMGVTGADDALERFMALFEKTPRSAGAAESSIRAIDGIIKTASASMRILNNELSEGIRNFARFREAAQVMAVAAAAVDLMTGRMTANIEALTANIEALTGTVAGLGNQFQFLGFLGSQVFDRLTFGAERLLDVLKSVLRQLASRAIMTALTLMGGDTSFTFRNLFKGIIGVGDALITSGGDVIQFHPDDNILAMKDFSGLGGEKGGTTFVEGLLKGEDIFLSNARSGARFR